MTDAERLRAQVAGVLAQRLGRPCTGPGSELLGSAALAQFRGSEVAGILIRYCDKIIETWRDGRRHDFLAVPPGGGVAVWCNAWPGSHLEALPQRFGSYLDQLAGKAAWLVERGVRLTGILEIDGYVIDRAGTDPVDLEIEYSFLPGRLAGGVAAEDPHFRTIVVNPGLCSAEQRQALERFMA